MITPLDLWSAAVAWAGWRRVCALPCRARPPRYGLKRARRDGTSNQNSLVTRFAGSTNPKDWSYPSLCRAPLPGSLLVPAAPPPGACPMVFAGDLAAAGVASTSD
jgi:hypothetical protein